ncbi:hypothetical protein U9M48_010856 [Paspalum notatum var. saurae]|uniref:Uncharacterized protein n=1 Tax=Paspalum notatum var. saurae TaxID=547442 RepID=A0AAQ3WGT2_PASNO
MSKKCRRHDWKLKRRLLFLLVFLFVVLVICVCSARLLLLGLFQRRHQGREARVRAVVGALGRQVLGDVGGRHVHLPQQVLDGAEPRVRVHVEVRLGQEPERLDAAVGHLDVLVHAAAADERGVQLLHVVGGEDDDALAAARRPQPVDEVEEAGQGDLAGGVPVPLVGGGGVERAVDVLDDDDGLAGGLDEELAEVGVGVHGRELDVVDVVVEVVGHGGDHGGLARPRRAVQEVAALPGLADARVVVLAVPEHVEVVRDLLLLGRVHGERGERLGVLEHHVRPRRPHVPAVAPLVRRDVGEELPLAVLDHDGAALPPDVRQVGVEHQLPVALQEEEPVEAALLLRAGAAAPPRRHPAVRARRRLGGRPPPHRGAPELVRHLLAVHHAEHELVGVLGALGPEVAHAAGAGVAEVGLDLLVGVAAEHAAAVVLGDGHRQVGVHHGRQPARMAVEVAAEELLQLQVLQVLPHHRPQHGDQAQHHAGVEPAQQRPFQHRHWNLPRMYSTVQYYGGLSCLDVDGSTTLACQIL